MRAGWVAGNVRKLAIDRGRALQCAGEGYRDGGARLLDANRWPSATTGAKGIHDQVIHEQFGAGSIVRIAGVNSTVEANPADLEVEERCTRRG